MTTPPPDPLDSLIGVGHKLRDTFAADLKRVHLTYHVAGYILAALLVLVGVESYRYHTRKLARLEAAASVEKVKAAEEHALALVWKVRAEARVEVVRVDTVRIASLVYRTRTIVAPVPVTAPDGTVSEVPMPVVLRTDFDTLGRACNRLAGDCASALAAKDSAAAHDSTVIATLYELNHNTEQRLKMADRAKFWSKLLYGAGGASAGYAIGRASCPR